MCSYSSSDQPGSDTVRRLGIRLRKEGKMVYPHTLNASGLATPRTFIAIVENYQEKDGSILIPERLKPYMHGIEKIEPEIA